MNLNKVMLIGRLTADPQLKTTPGGQSVATFSVATSRFWKDQAGVRQEKTEYHNVVVWGRQAEVASQFLTKGGMVLVEGRLQTRSWQDKQGAERKTTEIVCERLQFGPRSQGQGQGGAERQVAGGERSSASPRVAEEIPSIELDSEEIKPEDLPF